MHIVFRDDDTSFFAQPDLLARIYAPLWERGLPVSLAVIPAHAANICIEGEAGRYDPNIPPAYQGQARDYPITDNAALCDFLAGQVRAGLVEIAGHGYNHAWMEYRAEDVTALRHEAGRRILRDAVPDARITTFVPPYGCLSQVALDRLRADGWDIVVNTSNWPPLPLLSALEPQRCVRLPEGNRLFVIGGPTDPFAGAEGWLAAAAAHETQDTMLVCLNHFWMFYDADRTSNPNTFSAWERFLDAVLDRFAPQITTFQALASRTSTPEV